MTTFNTVIHEEKQTLISWTSPSFLPDHYVHIVSCKLLCDPTTYYLTEIVTNKLINSTMVYGVHPGSICLVRHLAVYNPASIDPGIGLCTRTPYSSKFQNINLNMCLSMDKVAMH